MYGQLRDLWSSFKIIELCHYKGGGLQKRGIFKGLELGQEVSVTNGSTHLVNRSSVAGTLLRTALSLNIQLLIDNPNFFLSAAMLKWFELISSNIDKKKPWVLTKLNKLININI